MKSLLIGLFVQEDGAVTVEWVVLTAAIIGLGLLVVAPIATGTTSIAALLTDYIGLVQVGATTTAPPSCHKSWRSGCKCLSRFENGGKYESDFWAGLAGRAHFGGNGCLDGQGVRLQVSHP